MLPPLYYYELKVEITKLRPQINPVVALDPTNNSPPAWCQPMTASPHRRLLGV